MTGVRVRRARPTDAEAVAGVHVETWRAAYAGVLPASYLANLDRAALARQWRAACRDAGRRERVLLAEDADGPVVGFGSCGPERTSDLGYEGEVYTLYVAPDWQGRDIGRALLTALFNELRDGGARSAVIWVLGGNPARFFYERLGGRHVGERSQPVAGASVGEHAYAWPDLAAWIHQMDG